jgi:hypothetical protein
VKSVLGGPEIRGCVSEQEYGILKSFEMTYLIMYLLILSKIEAIHTHMINHSVRHSMVHTSHSDEI